MRLIRFLWKRIDRKGDRFTVELDLHLHDGKPFTASFTGELRNGLDTEE